MKIMIVDDSQQMRGVIKIALGSLNGEFIRSKDGCEATGNYARVYAFLILHVLMIMGALGQTTYTWSGSSGANWATSTNWTPNRSAVTSTDILVFNTSGTVNLDFTSPENIGQIHVTNNSYVTFIGTAAKRLNISGGTGVDLQIETGSTLSDSSNSIDTIAVLTTASGSVSGTYRVRGSTAITAHRLTAADAGSLVFQNGSLCYVDTLYSGNLFGGGTTGSVIFASGSTYAQKSGSNPFSTSGGVVTFQTGSLFRLDGNIVPSFSGRTYADFESNTNGATVTVTGASAVSIDNLTITSGTLNFNMTGTPGHSIKGNVSVASGATLNFNPSTSGTVNFNGSSEQTISGSGSLVTGGLSRWVVNNSSGIVLSRNQTFFGLLLTFTSGNISLGSSNISFGNSAVIGAGAGKCLVTNGSGSVSYAFSGTGTFTFPVGATTSTYNPVTVALGASNPAEVFTVSAVEWRKSGCNE